MSSIEKEYYKLTIQIINYNTIIIIIIILIKDLPEEIGTLASQMRSGIKQNSIE